MRVASLGSGSRGNALYVEEAGTRVLVDVGFSGAQLARRLEALGVDPGGIDAVIVTHDHRDHTAGAGVAARRWGWPLFMSPATRAACASLLRGHEEVRTFEAGARFEVGALRVTSFLTCHDAADPLAVTVTGAESGLKLGVATDLGRPTTGVRAALAGCHFLVLEANHDEVLLREGPYPWAIKERIGGSRGHLSNRMAAELAVELLHPGLCGILLAHLSQECNDPERARGIVAGALYDRGWKGAVHVADQDDPSPLFDLPGLVARAGRGPQLDLFRTVPR
ncbi:MAG: MBL fold metallo-hydrolase [Candidatus Palauibacterales bacterium]|nr:MBL fold metallo-hydrolase [Candidatus Palauibacterales bacterium]MDP2582913.1 MBL fold metallo-hydrolase [Candidatus Palauibacterales bacterium]